MLSRDFVHSPHDLPKLVGGVPDPRWERLRREICARCIFHSQQTDIFDVTTESAAWTIDLRLIFLDSAVLLTLAEIFWERYHAEWPFQIAGMEAGSIPLLTAILLTGARRGTPVNAIWVRKERKPHGRMQLIEGVPSTERVVLIDDIFNSGSTSEKLVTALTEAGLVASDLFVVITYGSMRGWEWQSRRKVRLTHLFTIDELGLELNRTDPTTPSHRMVEIWRFRAPKPNLSLIAPKSIPLILGDALWFGSDDGSFWTLDKRTGDVRRRFRTRDSSGKGIMSSPAAYDGRVYVGAYDGNVYCLDAENGQVRWRFGEAGWIHSSPAIAAELGALFIGLEMERRINRGLLVALDLETGQKRWEFPVREFLPCSPLYLSEQGIVVTGTNEGEIHAVQAIDGVPLWRVVTAGAVKQQGVFDSRHGRVLFGSFDGGVYAIDLADGLVAWRCATQDMIFSTPLIVQDKVFIGSYDKHIHIIDLASGTAIKRIYVAARITAQPILVDGIVFFGTFSGQFLSIDPATLEICVEAVLPDRITTMIRHDPETDVFYVSTFDNRIHAVRRETIASVVAADPA